MPWELNGDASVSGACGEEVGGAQGSRRRWPVGQAVRAVRIWTRKEAPACCRKNLGLAVPSPGPPLSRPCPWSLLLLGHIPSLEDPCVPTVSMPVSTLMTQSSIPSPCLSPGFWVHTSNATNRTSPCGCFTAFRFVALRTLC